MYFSNKCRVNFKDDCFFRGKQNTLDKIVSCYEKNAEEERYFPDRWMVSVKKQSSLENAIKMACSCRDEFGHVHPHSRRLQIKNLNQLAENLINDIKRIESVKDFHSLYCLFLENKVSGIGDLTMYDIGLRLGYYLNIEPIYIYLHACPLKSVKKLGILNKTKKNRKYKFSLFGKRSFVKRIERIKFKFNAFGTIFM
ncbi:MAG: hypothetical protein LBD88_03455 [Candidatus Peribacteria bacterium]|jgi:hypothetical protein|nr:hypothetical protein [Candidatus Peribacteria bacterium]